jgi:diguanylate cyclase (GGDEF)-like protein/PAS domain S-box-containing protein
MTIIVMSAFVAVRYQSNAELMRAALQERSLGVASRVATSVQLTIWNIYQKTYERRYSEEFASAILDAEMQSPFVRGIKILGNFDHLYTGKIKIGDYSVPYFPELHDVIWSKSDKRLRHPVSEGKMTIGNIEVIYSDYEFAENLKQSLIIDITQVAIVGLLFVISLYLVLRRALVAPLQSLQLAHQALSSLDEAVFVINDVGLLIDLNPSYTKMTHFSQANALNHRPSLYAKQHPKLTITELIYLDSDKSNNWSGEVVCQRKGGSEFPGWMSVHKVIGKDTSVRYVAVLNDIEEKLEAQQKLNQLAYFDPLTQVSNRHSFMQSIDQDSEFSHQNKQPLALLYIDLDNFKWINDSYGHSVGDKLLVEISQRMIKLLRPEDQLFRIGGDEFTIIVRSPQSITHNIAQNTENLAKFANAIIDSAAQDFYIGDITLRTGVSIGIAVYPQDTENSQTLVKQADIAMFQAKVQGRGQLCFFSQDFENKRIQDQNIVNDLKVALSNQELSLFLQPKIDIQSEGFEVHSAEALIRWHRNGEVLYTPDEFIIVAEQSDLICEIGYWVIERACQRLRTLKKQGIDNFSIAINLSPKQLKDEKLFGFLRDTLFEYQINAGELEIEITENAVIEDIRNSIQTLERLRSLGIRIAMDDFGTGYSSLSYLKLLPIDILKIDRAFINKSPYEADDIAIVSAIFSMAKALGIKVVAEGVETRKQLDFLIANDCHFGQGFYFTKPLNDEQFLSWYKEHQLSTKPLTLI